jgi:hypothetical protein
MPAPIFVLPNARFERLRFVACLPSKLTTWGKRRRGLFLCDCGRAVDLDLNSVRHGHTRSCGCILNEFRKGPRSHGATTGGATPEYRSWKAMKNRCTQPRVSGYTNYGGRGISICKRWHSFENFLADVGKKPSPDHTLDRIHVDGNYEPKNVRWATRRDQGRNTRMALLRQRDACVALLREVNANIAVPSLVRSKAAKLVARIGKGRPL